MRGRAALICVVMVAWVVAAAAQVTEPTTSQPAGVRVEEAKVDLGDVKAGSDAVATFVLHNDGTEPVKILRAKPS